mgnify:CR=1 FL=1
MQNLGDALGAWRRENSLGIRAAAKMIGIGHNTLSRLENGKPCDADTMLTVINWLFGGQALDMEKERKK